jgi:ferredoxin-type protein NapH
VQLHDSTLKYIRSAGLLLFVAGFGLFLAVFFLSSYRLTEESLQQALDYPTVPPPNAGSQTLPEGTEAAAELPATLYELARQEAEPMMGETYSWNYRFVRELEEVFARTNAQVRQQYGLTEGEIEAITEHLASRHGLTYQAEAAAEALKGNGALLADKQQRLKDYTSWMEGKSYDSPGALQTDLSGVANNLNRELIERKGINPHEEASLKTSLVKQATQGPVAENTLLFFALTFGLTIIGALLYILPGMREMPGIKHNGIFFNPLKNRGWLGIMLGTFLILFYVLLYFYPYYMTNWIMLADPISLFFRGNEASEFFLYGLLYTIAILVMGVRMLIKYRHSKYHIFRTFSIMFFQLAFAFLIPEILVALQQPYYDFKNIWPLNYDVFFEYRITEFLGSGMLGMFMLIWGIALVIIAVPLFTYFLGKRWYCSWVCGCGGLAETFGDPYRQLSDKRLVAWKVERWLVHGVLVFAVVMTAAVLYTFFTGESWILGIDSYTLRWIYGFLIGAVFAGVIGTGFYPLMGNRVWCRFGCPLAAYIGLVQRFKSRFRITTNGGQCISCGNCSTYCEMGIDVRWYAQRGQNIVRASCVGCGVCSSVCPRGVLKLENNDPAGRLGLPVNEII